jgi:tripartite-type tricarboxylate transporter receptor subunit TctC
MTPRALAAALALSVSLVSCARQERFPEAPILVICPWTAGGGTDRVARQLSALLEQDLGVPVNVVNATGGDGVTGHSRGALSRPDGYSMTLVTSEIATLHWRGMTSVSHRDFAAVGLVNRDAGAIFVRADSPWRTLKDVEQAIRRAPRKLRASGTATAGIWHLGLAGWLSTVGIKPTDVIWVSISGSAPSLQELMAGGVDLVACSLPEAQALLSAGRIRSLGVMADARAPQFPDVPTFKEQGIDWTLGTLRGLAVPKDTPPERVRILADAVRRVVEGNAYREAMQRSGFTPVYEDPAQFTASLVEIDTRLGGLLSSEAFRGLAVKLFGPMFFPSLLAAALILVLIGIAATGGKRRPPAEAEPLPVAPPGAAWRFAEVVLWVVVYIAVAETLGFIVTAGVLLLVHLLRLGTRAKVAVPLAVILVPAAYQVFAVFLRVPLPRGIFGW